jgi:peptidyl-prolyl cis-trans isomerase C
MHTQAYKTYAKNFINNSSYEKSMTQKKKTSKKTKKKSQTYTKKPNTQKSNIPIYAAISIGILVIVILAIIFLRAESNEILGTAQMLEIRIGETIEVRETGKTFTIYSQDLDGLSIFYRLENYVASEAELLEQVAVRKILLENSNKYSVNTELFLEELDYMRFIIDSIPEDLPELKTAGITKKQLLALAEKRLQDDIKIQNYLNQEIVPLIPLEQAIEASHILICFENKMFCDSGLSQVEAYELIQEIKAQANSDTFGDLANMYSNDASGDGGYLGFFTRGMMVPEFESIAFSTAVESISDIVETDFGYHIIYVQNIDLIPNEQFAIQLQNELFYAIQEKINITQ